MREGIVYVIIALMALWLLCPQGRETGLYLFLYVQSIDKGM